MPELPEVQTVVTSLRPRLLGQTISRVNLARTDIVTPPHIDLPKLLAGRTFANIHRRAKRIMLTMDNGNVWYIHLGMTGRLTLDESTAEVLPHTHLTIDLDPALAPSPSYSGERVGVRGQPLTYEGGLTAMAAPPPSPGYEGPGGSAVMQLRFRDPRRFGGVWWLGENAGADDIGPEPLTLRPAQLARRLHHTTRAIKNALLDQTVIAGLGNIYVDESLFTAGIHPLTPADTLTLAQINKLNRSIKATLRRALTHRGSTLRDYRDANGAPGDFQKLHRVYDREGKPCATCKSPIRRIVIGGRSTHFCENCQRPA